MTREETIGQLKFMLEQMPEEPQSECDYIEEWLDTDRKIRSAFKTAIKIIEQEPCEDCVSRKSLLDKLDPLYKEKIKTAPDNMAEGFLQVSNLIKYEPSVTPTQRWIPVSERLPEKEGDYLLWGKVCEDEEEYQFIGSYDSGCEQFGIWQEQFDRTTLGCLGSEFFEYASVVAWMPLPEPYKAEMESEE